MGDATSGLATEARLLATEASLQAQLAATEASLEQGLLELRADLAAFEARFVRALWVQGFGILAGTGAIITIVSVLD
ncbi:MAG: hypothetical protein OXF01_12370 [Gemmatimonadetes bacterium]|nr:hypothetical protein [Gemmatimonadota bacterium]